MITNNMNVTERFSGKWETKRLGDIASIRNQKVLPANVNADTPCVELDHIGSGNGQLLKSSTAEYSTASKYRFFAGDVLFGRLRSYLRKFWLADRDGICTTEIWPLMVDTEQVDSEFLHAIVQSDQFFSMASISYGTHMPRTDWGVMRNFTVMLPQVQEQRAIAEVLSDVDGLLNALEALIVKKRAIKQATMQQLLTGKTRLPGFSGAWETKRLMEIADCLDNVRVPLNETQRATMTGPYPYCGANGVLDYVKDYVLDDDVILIAEDGGHFDEFLSRPIAYRMRGKIWVNNHAHILKAKSDYDQGFLYFSLVHKNILPYLSGGTRAKLNKFEMYKIEVNVPDDTDEQSAIASVLSDMDAEIAALEQRRDKTRAIKQGMMQQLLTGRVRLVK